MKVELIIPIERLRGKLRKDGYYFREYRGQQIVQRCPRTQKDTPGGKKTMKSYLWSLELAAYDANHQG